jgi:hypothetical protein
MNTGSFFCMRNTSSIPHLHQMRLFDGALPRIPFILGFHPKPGLILLLAQKNEAKKRAISRVVQSA